jgi:hypothetical protein
MVSFSRTACVCALFCVLAQSAPAQNRVSLLPKLHAGQKLAYQIRLRIDKHTQAESRVASPIAPAEGRVDILRTIAIEVLDVASGNPRDKLLLRLQIFDPAIAPPSTKTLDLSIRPDGTVDPPQIPEALTAEDTQAWQAWLGRFAFGWSLPAKTPNLGERWNSEESIAGGPLAQLSWQKESQYVRDEKCPSAQSPTDRCAVLLTTAVLKQRSSPKDATPDDFKLRELKTSGTTKGRNETFTYISLSNGLVIRSSEEAHQFLDVIIAKANGSNQVHYNIDASSSTEMLLLPQ